MSGQKPLKQRCQETMELLWKREKWGVYPARIDKQVVKKLIATGRAKLVTVGRGGGGWHKNGTKPMIISHTVLMAVEQPPKKEVVDTGGPYAKRRAALEELEGNYRGKNLGRPKVIGERRLTKAQKKKLEKQQMWEKLQKEDFGKTRS